MKVSDIVDVPVATTINYEGFQLLEGHVLHVADGRRHAALFAVDRQESEDLVTGFEVGLLMVRLSATPPTWRGAFHVASGAMLERAAKSMGYQMKSEPPWADGVWMFCDFILIASPEKCCERDHDGDGNCDRHPGKLLSRSQRRDDMETTTPFLKPCPHCGASLDATVPLPTEHWSGQCAATNRVLVMAANNGYSVEIREVSTGETVTRSYSSAWVSESDPSDAPGDGSLFWWTDGNAGCAASRSLEFWRGKGLIEPEVLMREAKCSCQEDAQPYLVRITLPDGKVVLDEFDSEPISEAQKQADAMVDRALAGAPLSATERQLLADAVDDFKTNPHLWKDE